MERHQQQAAAVYRSSSRKDCLTRALVLESAGIGCSVQRVGGEFTLLVAAADAARAQGELDDYAQENRGGSAVGTTIPRRADGWTGVLGYAVVLLLVAVLEDRDAFGVDWLATGKTHAGLIRQGEWWRAVTALTLHVDPAHLLANVVIGGLFGLFAGQLLGSGLAWAGILIAGTAGNLLNAYLRHASHTSVGASTAVFAALGIVAAYAWTRRRDASRSRLKRWAPLVGGIVLLSYLGTGGARTDVLAHVAGFLSGLLLGALYGKLGDRAALAARTQFLLGMGVLALLTLAWTLALTSHAARPA
ncbi:MAG: rhomboid family intramembrane serine protease [bacterium]|nr:rhomboid family intramembrane serine protease [bacterium]